jgi:predicted Zn-dependent protease
MSGLSGIDDYLKYIPRSIDVMLGNEYGSSMEAEFGGVLNDPQLAQRVNNVGSRLLQHVDAGGFEYQFNVLNNNMVNAFALPGGRIYITKGLLDLMTNEAQLAAVLGHEIGHVDERHGTKSVVAGVGVTALLTLASGLTNKQVLQDGYALLANLFQAGYSRDNESESDEFGLDTMVAAGYNPLGAVQLMQIFQLANSGDSNIIEDLFRTHPRPEVRIEDLQKRIEEKYPLTGTFGQDFNSFGSGLTKNNNTLVLVGAVALVAWLAIRK